MSAHQFVSYGEAELPPRRCEEAESLVAVFAVKGGITLFILHFHIEPTMLGQFFVIKEIKS